MDQRSRGVKVRFRSETTHPPRLRSLSLKAIPITYTASLCVPCLCQRPEWPNYKQMGSLVRQSLQASKATVQSMGQYLLCVLPELCPACVSYKCRHNPIHAPRNYPYVRPFSGMLSYVSDSHFLPKYKGRTKAFPSGGLPESEVRMNSLLTAQFRREMGKRTAPRAGRGIQHHKSLIIYRLHRDRGP